MATVDALFDVVGPLVARDLGARGSRNDVSGSDPAAELTGEAATVLAALPGWWAERAAIAGLSGNWLDVFYALSAEPPDLPYVEAAEEIDSSTTGFDLGVAYTAGLSAAVRARHGRHYTPEALSEHLWTMARSALGHSQIKRLPGLVRDPACGGGALLIPPLREHLTALSKSDPTVTIAGLPGFIQGIDSDPAAVWLTNVVLAAEALPLLAKVSSRRRRPLPALASVGDGLSETLPPARVVLMNPPYGRVRLSESDRSRFAHVLYGHANLYGIFLAAATDQLDSQGVLGALVPTSFTAGRYFSNLRAVLGATAPLREITFVADRDGVFAGVLQETCLGIFSRKKARRAKIYSANGAVSEVATVASPRGGEPWLLPRRSDDAHVAAAAAQMPLTLAAAGWKISTGPLVWNRRKGDLSAKPVPDSLPIVWAADLDGGKLHQDRARDSLRYVTIHGHKDAKTMALDSPAILVQRTTAPEQTRRIVSVDLGIGELAAWGGSVVVENHVNVIRPSVPDPLITRETLGRVLSTRTVDQLIRCVSGSVAVSAYELESLPLPDSSVLRTWEKLRGLALEKAVADAYTPGAS
ncbi:Eco57I restriction-modification methylase domain-containing protein [Pseudonocardia alni]|uniref:Eco57I restriction-modification methylase domain-containing protein n=1 Tax=Pseudonocardia alni TaxID=33907 RepID=UPI0037166C69